MGNQNPPLRKWPNIFGNLLLLPHNGDGRRATAVPMLLPRPRRPIPIPTQPDLTSVCLVTLRGLLTIWTTTVALLSPSPFHAVMLSAVYSGISRSRARYNRKLFYLLLIAVHKTLPTAARGFSSGPRLLLQLIKQLIQSGTPPLSPLGRPKPRMKLKSCQNQTQLTNSTRRNSIVVGGHF